MSDSEAQAELAELLLAHGLETATNDDGWLVPTNTQIEQPPVMAVRWHPRDHGGQLDVHVSSDTFHLIESCAGYGNGEEGLFDSFNNFARNSLHVILADCYDIIEPDQVLQEVWHINGKNYLATIGNISGRTTGKQSPLPDEFYERLEQAILHADLGQPRHWFRFFAAHLPDNQMIFESLHNNEPWEPGRQVLEHLEWEQTDYYYSLRLFMMLQAHSEGE